MVVSLLLRRESRLATRYFLAFVTCVFYFGLIKSQSQRVIYSHSDRQKILSAHNQERRLVGNQDLIWDYELEEFAADWASTLSSRGSGLSHRPNNKYGENCYWSSTSSVIPDAAILAFNEEKEMYNYGPVSYQNFNGTGHYTQVVWYRTTKVGCAAVSGSLGTYVVCNYDPPGNLIGDYPYNKTNVNATPPPVKVYTQIEPEQIIKPKYPDQSPALTQVPTTVRVTAPNPTLKPTPNEPMKSKGYPSEVSSKTKQKSSELKRAPYIFMFSGVETWTKNHDLPLITQMKLKQDINFTGASPVFQLNATLPKKPGNKINDIRGVFSIGFTLSNSILQNEFGQAIGNYQSSPRLYSPVYYDFGLQCWKYFQINLGQTIFGLMGTSNTLDYAVLNRCGIRFIMPMGRNLTISVHGSITGQTVDISNWSMASLGLSLRSKFY
jgi:pathogenesis-related protein 1